MYKRFLFLCFCLALGLWALSLRFDTVSEQKKSGQESVYWMVLHRQQNREVLYKGVAGDMTKSIIVKTFVVKTGIPNKRPTPLPELLGRSYWLITGKEEAFDNEETGPYFLSLDIPAPTEVPFGPYPYNECGGQCNWEVSGAFGLHGVAGNMSKLAKEDPGSSGCIRHSDEDITYLYKLLDPQKTPIRYYVDAVGLTNSNRYGRLLIWEDLFFN